MLLIVILAEQGDQRYDQAAEIDHEHEHLVLNHECSPFFRDVVCICIRTTSLLFKKSHRLTYLLEYIIALSDELVTNFYKISEKIIIYA